ncbi:SRPBCC family protein [Streptomyces sp. NPDC093094]|uniref:SRPBCC family protein n=1 Tax=Streptomyces sp. NPDC093094 TaxID=3366026 RepID=UPI0038132666
MDVTDVPHVQSDLYVQAAVPQVWALVTDIHVPARHSPELQHVAWLDGAVRPSIGARFEGRNRHFGGAEWRTVSHVVELDEHRSFAWAVLDEHGLFGEAVRDPAQALAFWRFDLEADGDGTRLRHTAAFGPGRSGLTLAVESAPGQREQIIASRQEEWRTGMEHTLRGLKEAAERTD